MGLQAGAAEVKITPPVGVDLFGYAARPGPSAGVHDDLWAHALVLDDGARRVALLALDLLGTDLELDALFRQAVSQAAETPPDHLLLNFSHTHAGPVTGLARLGGMGAIQRDYLDALPELLGRAAAQAAARLAPARLRYGAAPARVGINRRERRENGQIVIGRNPQGLVDDEMRALLVESSDGEPIAILFHHACHGTTLGGNNLLITAEWMGAASARLREHYGAPPLFLQGCAGQTNPDASEATFEEMERLGALAYHAIVRALSASRPLEATPLGAVKEEIALPLQDPPPVEIAAAELARAEREAAEARQVPRQSRDGGPSGLATGAHPYWVRALESLIPKARETLELSRQGATGLTLPFVVQALALGELALVGLSGEVFLEFAHHIVRDSPFPNTWVLGYSNGCQGYVPTREALAEGGYEGADSFRWYGTLPLAPEAGEVMVEAAVRMLNQLRPH